MRLKDRVAIVTGGGRGIGRAYCFGLAKEGAAVVVADLAAGDAAAVAGEITAGGGRAIAVGVDISEAASTQGMARAAAEAFGGVDILVNNAAMFANLTRAAWDQFSPPEWDRVMAVNVRGPWLTCLAVVPLMRRLGKGKIIIFGSSAIFTGDSRLVHYVTSKAAVMGLTRALARELGAENICVNCLHPGQTMSGTNDAMTPPEYVEAVKARRSLKRVQVSADLVGTLLYLASDDSDFVTGQSIVVDGGVSFIG